MASSVACRKVLLLIRAAKSHVRQGQRAADQGPYLVSGAAAEFDVYQRRMAARNRVKDVKALCASENTKPADTPWRPNAQVHGL
jgi:hypothetical protein